jgi:hypothetical protein
MPQIQGAKGEAIVSYCKPLATQEMRYPRLVRLWRAFPKGKQQAEKALDKHSIESDFRDKP